MNEKKCLRPLPDSLFGHFWCVNEKQASLVKMNWVQSPLCCCWKLLRTGRRRFLPKLKRGHVCNMRHWTTQWFLSNNQTPPQKTLWNIFITAAVRRKWIHIVTWLSSILQNGWIIRFRPSYTIMRPTWDVGLLPSPLSPANGRWLMPSSWFHFWVF